MSKGFALIEILGVIVLISILALVMFPSTVNKIKETEVEINETTKIIIDSAIRLYMASEYETYPQNVDDVYCIAIEDIINAGFLKRGLLELDNGFESSDILEVKFVSTSTYETKVSASCMPIYN